MFLLTVLTGFLLVFQGHGYRPHGSRNSAARELEDYNQFLDDLSSRYKKILDVHHKRQEQNRIEIPNVEWSNIGLNDDEESQNEILRNGINYAAVDADDNDESPAKDDNDENANLPNNEKTNEEDPELETSTDKEVVTNAELPLKPHKLVAKPEGGHIPGVNGNDFLFLVLVSACSVAGLVGLIMAGVCWYKLHKRVKAASDVDYPAYGVTGPTKERLPSPGDRKLAQSAQMYHYQHQKQQMIAMEKANGEMKQDGSEEESEEENEEGDYTVYECPGLAPTGEMEVRNPLFTEEAQTPVNGQPATNGVPDDNEQE